MEAVLEMPTIEQNSPEIQSEDQGQAKLRKPRPKRINYGLGGAMVASGKTFEEAAPLCGAKNGHTLQVGLANKGVTAKTVRTVRADVEVEKMTVRTTMAIVVEQAGAVLREKYAQELDRRADDILTVPRTKNLDKLAKAGQVLESQVRAAKIVHGWADSTSPGLVLVDATTSAERSIEASLVAEPSENTTTGGVVSTELSDSTPQDASH